MGDGLGYEPVGVSLVGPPPIDQVHFRWRTGLHVLYGRNGAGKSRILEGITSSKCYQHIRLTHTGQVDDPEDEFLESSLWCVASALCQGILDAQTMRSFHWQEPWHGEFVQADPENPHQYRIDWLFETLVEMRLATAISPVNDSPTILREICEQRLLSFYKHRVYASVLLQDAPSSHREINRVRRLAATWGWEDRSFEHVDQAISFMLNVTPEQRADLHPFWPAAKLAEGGWPPNVPIPLLALVDLSHRAHARVPRPLNFGPLTGSDPESSTNEWLKHILTREVDIEEDIDTAMVNVGILKDYRDDLQSLANQWFRGFLPGTAASLRLELELLPPRSWPDGRVGCWRVVKTGINHPLDQLSPAEYRWASVAISLALVSLDDGWQEYRGFVIDEPEAGLHPVAVDGIAEALSSLSQSVPIFIATHSPRLLAGSDRLLHHVTRDPTGITQVQPFQESRRRDLTTMGELLGCTATDLLHLYSVFLAVEGEHDRIALETIFGAEWEQCRTRFLPMRGAQSAPTIPAIELLLEFTTAYIVIVLDNARETDLLNIWEDARRLAESGNTTEANRRLGSIDPHSLTPEERYFLQAAKSAISRNVSSRIELYGLSKRDIITYLEPTSFGLSSSWDELEQEYESYRAGIKSPGGKPGETLGFKKWLSKKKNGTINKRTVAKAAQEASDSPDPELTELLSLCRRLAGVDGGLHLF